MTVASSLDRVAASLRAGTPTVWLRPDGGRSAARGNDPVTLLDVADAAARMERFAPALRKLFPGSNWDGRVRSALLDYPVSDDLPDGLLVKADHALPMTGSIKARGGVYALLCCIERFALDRDLLRPGADYAVLTTPAAARILAMLTVAVSSTGNLGFSIGLVARAFGARAQVHMSRDARAWKKQRLVRLGAEVIEHDCDFTETVARGRAAAARSGAVFVDDETSRELFVGYALAADEVIAQLTARGVEPSAARPLVVYLPCGVGGAPGGVTFGLKQRLGKAVSCVFVEPVASAGMLLALATGTGRSVSVYDVGLDNVTIADGLAVPLASQLVLDQVGHLIDAAIALPDAELIAWAGRAWMQGGLRLEPSAAASLAAVRHLIDARPDLIGAPHVAWTTGGSLLPDDEFDRLMLSQ